jgi:hypothetical protein
MYTPNYHQRSEKWNFVEKELTNVDILTCSFFSRRDRQKQMFIFTLLKRAVEARGSVTDKRY